MNRFPAAQATLAQDAARLRQMAEEVCAITSRVRALVRSQTRDDAAFNAEGMIGGLVNGLRRAARDIDELDRSLRL